MNRPPDRVEHWQEYAAEYRRMRDSRGEELLSVTMRRDTVTPADTVRLREFIISMDALERFASHEVPDRCLAKTFDWRRPDSVERFKEFTAFFHAGRSLRDGSEVSFVRFAYGKEQDDKWLVQPKMWVPHEAVKEFSAHGIAYEKEVGLTKHWHPLVRVTAPGASEDTGVVQVLASVEGGARERAQLKDDRSVELVLWPYPFRQRFEEGDLFTVRHASEGQFGYGKIGMGIERELLKRDREGQVYLVGLWHERSCEPCPGMAVRINPPSEHNNRAREMLVFPEGGPREPGYPKTEYVLITKNLNRPGHGILKRTFGQNLEKAVAELHTLEELHRLHDLSQQVLPGGYRQGYRQTL